MSRLAFVVSVLALLLVADGQGLAQRARVATGPTRQTTGVVPRPRFTPGERSRFGAPGHPPRRHYNYFYGYPGAVYYYPIFVTPGYYYYNPYFVNGTIVTSDPFFCLAHQVGFISRAGMLDHLAGTHNIPLETAAAVCPDGTDGCLVEGY